MLLALGTAALDSLLITADRQEQITAFPTLYCRAVPFTLSCTHTDTYTLVLFYFCFNIFICLFYFLRILVAVCWATTWKLLNTSVGRVSLSGITFKPKQQTVCKTFNTFDDLLFILTVNYRLSVKQMLAD